MPATDLFNMAFASHDTKSRVHIVQHSVWNEESTSPVDLDYVKNNTDYHKIADGNATGNGTPGLKTVSDAEWARATTAATTGPYWKKARAIANKYNGEDDRYLKEDFLCRYLNAIAVPLLSRIVPDSLLYPTS